MDKFERFLDSAQRLLNNLIKVSALIAMVIGWIMTIPGGEECIGRVPISKCVDIYGYFIFAGGFFITFLSFYIRDCDSDPNRDDEHITPY